MLFAAGRLGARGRGGGMSRQRPPLPPPPRPPRSAMRVHLLTEPGSACRRHMHTPARRSEAAARWPLSCTPAVSKTPDSPACCGSGAMTQAAATHAITAPTCAARCILGSLPTLAGRCFPPRILLKKIFKKQLNKCLLETLVSTHVMSRNWTSKKVFDQNAGVLIENLFVQRANSLSRRVLAGF
jgi:hypothetical protein